MRRVFLQFQATGRATVETEGDPPVHPDQIDITGHPDVAAILTDPDGYDRASGTYRAPTPATLA